MQIFNNDEIQCLKSLGNSRSNGYRGYVYVIEMGDRVKIGSTANPLKRVNALVTMTQKYGNVAVGRIAFSQPHTNFRQNEATLHKRFADVRVKGTELFDAEFDAVVKEADSGLTFEDRSKELATKDAMWVEGLRQFLQWIPNQREEGAEHDDGLLEDSDVELYLKAVKKESVLVDLCGALLLAGCPKTDKSVERLVLEGIIGRNRAEGKMCAITHWSELLKAGAFEALYDELMEIMDAIDDGND